MLKIFPNSKNRGGPDVTRPGCEATRGISAEVDDDPEDSY